MSETAQITLPQALKGGLIAGAGAAVLNIIWNFIGQSGLDILVPLIGTPQVIGASIMPLLVGSGVYFLLAKNLTKGQLIFVILCAVLTLLSLGGTMQTTLPDGSAAPAGFPLLTIPMHLIAGGMALWGIPRFSK